MQKYGTARQAADDKMAHVHCVLHKAKYSFRIQYIFCFPWQQWLHECASMLCSYLHCLAVLMLFIHLWQDLVCIGIARFFGMHGQKPQWLCVTKIMNFKKSQSVTEFTFIWLNNFKT